jgi:hypothetical protein
VLTRIVRHYYESRTTINPSGVVPVGPEADLDAPHGRATLGHMEEKHVSEPSAVRERYWPALPVEVVSEDTDRIDLRGAGQLISIARAKSG